jgi:hypothetical protein
MDPEEDNNKSAGANNSTTGAETGPTVVARAMSVDMPDADGAAAGSDYTSREFVNCFVSDLVLTRTSKAFAHGAGQGH